jgi:hypothetical protein
MSSKGEMYKSKSAMKKHEMKEGSKQKMMEYGKKKPKAKAKKKK